MQPPNVLSPLPFPVTTESAIRRIAFVDAKSPIPLLLATTLRSMTAGAGWPDAETAMTPLLPLLEASLSTTVLSDAPVVNEPITMIPSRLLLFAVTLLSTPLTTAGPAGSTKVPLAPLLEAIVFDTEKLLDVLGEITIPTAAKFRMTQFSIARLLDGQAAQMNAVASAGIDRDAIARGSPDGRGADAVVDDAERSG